MRRAAVTAVVIGCLCTHGVRVAGAQDQQPSNGAVPHEAAPVAAVLPPGYVIGADDVLSILFWGEKDMSAEVTVRPDGKVTLPLLNDLDAAGLTPGAFRDVIVAAARKYVEAPNPTVTVKTVNSRKVFITGQVEKPGPYPLNSSTTVLQLLAMAGGVKEFARSKNIMVLRTDGRQQQVFRFNYQDVQFGKHLDQNIELKPGDTVVVP
jgi:polysaccharide export outer membrane protein